MKRQRPTKPRRPDALRLPSDVEKTLLAARAKLAEGALAPAIEGFRRVLEAAPTNAGALSGLASALAHEGRGREAVKCLRMAREAAAGDPSVEYEIGSSFAELRNFEEAAVSFRAVAARSPSSSAALLSLGYVSNELGREEDAKLVLERALLLEPLSARAWFELHRAVFDDRRLGPAIDALTRAVTSDPTDRLARFAFGVALDLAGDVKAAAQQLASIHPDKRVFAGAIDSYRYAKDHRTERTRFFASTWRTLHFALEHAKVDGLSLELGVGRGTSARWIAGAEPTRTLHGFDGFEGLPEAWGILPRGAYSTFGETPELPQNVVLHVGRFEETLPAFVRSHEGPIRFMHVDCDLYSATKTTFDALGERVVPGTILLFDDYLVNDHWREDEFKAFQEAAVRYAWKFEYLAFSLMTGQAAVRIL